MPVRREPTPEELAQRWLNRRRQNREAQRRFRAKGKPDANDVSLTGKPDALPENGALPSLVSLTPPPPTRDDVPPQKDAPLPPTGGPSPRSAPLAVPKPNKSGELIDLLRAAGVECELLEKHHAALKRTRLSAAEVAEVYIAIAEGRFGDDWLCDNVNVERAIAAWPNYQNRKLRGPRRPRPGRSESPSAIAERLFAGVGG